MCIINEETEINIRLKLIRSKRKGEKDDQNKATIKINGMFSLICIKQLYNIMTVKIPFDQLVYLIF